MTEIYLYKKFEWSKRTIIFVVIYAISILLAAFGGYYVGSNKEKPVETVIVQSEPVIKPIIIEEPPVEKLSEPEKTLISNDTVAETKLSNADIDLLSLVTMAEAEGESEEGQRLVIDTILNRVDSNRFPNTVHGVVYQANQFEAMWNGRVNKCYVKDSIRKLVLEELQNRTNNEVVFFRTGKYSDYGTPVFKVGNHYFSKY